MMDSGFQRRKRKERIYDKLHRSAVNTCMAVTAIAGIYLGYKVYEYFRYVRPLRLVQSKLTEEELLMEGRNLEETPDLKLSS